MSTNFAELVLSARTDGLLKAEPALNKVTKAGGKAEQSVTRLEKSTSGMSAGFAKAAKAAGAFGAALGVSAAISSSLRDARAFSRGLAEVSTLIEGTPAQMDALSKASKELAATYGSTATAQVDGFYQAISAGAASVEEATSVLDVANRLAVGGVTNVTTAVDILTSATNVYASEGLSAAEASDALFVAMKAGKTTISEMGGSLGKVLPLAQKLGIEFDEVAAATAALTKGGINTAESVTGINAALTSIIGPSKQASDLAKELGLEFNSSALEANGFAGFMGDVVEATGGSADQMRILFGSTEATKVALALAGEAGLSMGQILADMEGKAGATSAAFDKMANSQDQRLSVATAAMNVQLLRAGEVILPLLVPVVETVADAAVILANNFDTLGPILGAVGVAVAAMAAPFTLTAAAIGAAAVLIAGNWDEIKAAFMAGVDYVKAIPDKFEAAMFEVAFAIARGIDGMINSLSDGVEHIKDFGADVVAALKDMGRDALAAALTIGGDIVAGLKQGIQQKWADLKGYVSGLGTGMLDGIKDTLGIRSPSREFMEVGRWSVEGLEVGLDQHSHKAIDRARTLGTEIGKGVRDGLEPVLATIFDGLVKGNIKGIGNNILGMAQNSFSGILQGAFTTGGGGFAGVFDSLKSAATGIGSALSKGVGLFGKLGGAISSALPIIGAISTAISFFRTRTTDLDKGIRVLIDGLDSAVVQTYLLQEKVKWFGLSKKTVETVSTAKYDVSNPIQAAVNSIGATVMGLADTIGLASENLDKVKFKFDVSTAGKTEEQIAKAVDAEMKRLGNAFADAAIGSFVEYLPDEAEIERLNRQVAATYNIGGEGGQGRGEAERALIEQKKIAAETAIEVVHLNGALSDLQRDGEGSFDLLQRVVGELHGVNQAMLLFERETLDLSVAGVSAASKLATLSGGLEAFSTNTQFVFANMLTDTAQELRLTEIASEKLNGTLGALGIAIPETHAEFMAMLNAQDLMTEGGRNTHAALLDVAQAFVQVNGTAQQAADSIAAQNAAAAQAAQNARAADVSVGLDVAKARADAANAAMADADAMLRAAFAAERQRLSGSQSSSIDTSSISARVGLFNTIRDALERAYTDRRVLTALGQKMRLTDATAFLRSAVSSGGTSDVDRLEAALDAVADPSTALFKSFADYQHDYNVNTNLIERLKGLTDDSLSVEEKTLNSLESQSSILQSNNASQLAALDAQMNALLGIDNSVLSLGDAIAGFQSAKGAVSKAVDVAAPASTQFAAGSFGAKLDAIYMAELGRGVKQAGLDFYGGHYVNGLSLEDIQRDIMGSAEAAQYAATGIPAFASGGYHGGGVRLVGENGPELEVTGPSRIYSAPQTRNMMNSGNDNRDVVAALNETNARLRSLQKEVNSMARISRDQNVNGTPGTRTGAVVATQEVV
ncbi:phage tail tape measure protein [Sulfitobacter pacificus]|uniref:phage tail tape measure protein n=1 Tax=Sulfitobacter pacificus TaxID=1499314 RepID=UPI00310B41BE